MTAQILMFPLKERMGSPDKQEEGSCEILIFSGVRYERYEEPADVPAPRRTAGKRQPKS